MLNFFLVFVSFNFLFQTVHKKCSFNNGGCQHLCVPVDQNNAVCKCSIGYEENLDNSSLCDPVPNVLFYADDTQLYGILVDDPQEKMLAPIPHGGHITSIGYLASQQLLFWTDNSYGIIWSMKRDGSEYNQVLTDLESPIGLVVDWIAEHLYWTDNNTKVIEVCKIDGTFRKIIISGGLSHPSAIDLSPKEGLLFWSDNNPTRAKIERSNLDGSGRKPLFESSKIIIAIAVNYETGMLYFTYSDLDEDEGLYRLDYNAPLQPSVDIIFAKDPDCLMRPLSLSYYDRKIWWSDQSAKGGSLSYNDIENDNYCQTVKQNLGGDIILKLSSPELQPPDSFNGCQVDNSPCQELCLFTGQVTCHCSHRKISEDGQTCEDHKAFIVFSKVSDIESLHVNVNTNDNPPFPVINSESIMRNAIGLAYSYKDKLIFYSDIQSGSINSVHFNGSNHRRLLTKLGSVEGLAFDALQNYLFWTSTSDSTVKRVNINSLDSTDLVVQLSKEDKPRGIDLDTCSGMVYWTNWNRKNPAIQRAYYSGYNKTSIISSNIHMPNGLALDRAERKLYWADARLDKIEVCNMDGTNCQILVKSAAEHPFDLAVYDEFLFFTDWVLQAVVRINKLTGNLI